MSKDHFDLEDISNRIRDKQEVTPNEISYLLDKMDSNKTIWKKAKEMHERILKHAGIIEQEKANKLSENNIKINKWGLIISAILALIAIIISVFAYIKPI